MSETYEQRQQRTAAARRAYRTNAARVRFNKYADEMRPWGCTVVIPETLEMPKEK